MSTQPTRPRRALRPTFVILAAGFVAALAACSPDTAPPQVTLPSQPSVIVVTTDTGEQVHPTTLADVRARVPFDIKIPTWVPDDYQLSDEISVAADSAWVLLEWRAPDDTLVDLIISPVAPATPNAPPQFVHNVDIDGHEGQIILGLHNSAAGEWDPTLQTLLTWREGELYYSLATAGLTTTAKDLQRMAESMS
jgi:hypothetical protein